MKSIRPVCAALLLAGAVRAAESRPNVVYIMADELGYYELSCMGNPNLRTPHIDRMAAEGIRFNHLFAGSSVCAPTRCSFLTGKHSGHMSVRSNGGGTPLRAGEATIASVLKQKGYATGGFGKWGCGGRDSTGVPEQHGFDVFLGYYDQVHAHSYYPPYLIRNSEEVPLPGNQGGSTGTNYSQYAIHRAALGFIRENRDRPFFAYLPYTPPHGIFDIPDSDPAWPLFKDRPWPEEARRYAALVSLLDHQVGEVLALLKELGIDEKTLVFFSGDNGGADYFKSKEFPRGVHGANRNPKTGAEYRGHKGNLYEGGLRIPFLARWPGRIAAGRTSDHLGYFPDLLPTIAEAAGAAAPQDVDGLSLLPELIGEQAAGRPQPEHDFLYWEISGQTAVRQGAWRAVQPKPQAPWELYDLAADPGEARDLAAAEPSVLARLQALAAAAHAPVREGTFSSTARHERDRRAKLGQQDQPAMKEKGRGPVPSPMPTAGLIPNGGWRIVRASSENTANGKVAGNAIDGDPATLWHTRFSGGAVPPPHELVIDLGARRTISGFLCLARQDQSWNGAIRELEFCVSDSPDSFGPPVARASLEKTREPQRAGCPAAAGRYVLLRVRSAHDGQDFASLAELGLLGE